MPLGFGPGVGDGVWVGLGDVAGGVGVGVGDVIGGVGDGDGNGEADGDGEGVAFSSGLQASIENSTLAVAALSPKPTICRIKSRRDISITMLPKAGG